MLGSMALSIPFIEFTGQLLIKKKQSKSEHYSVPYLIDYLKYLKNNKLGQIIDVGNFENDINNGLIFETNIPISYGLGSSGAIVASIFNQYKVNDIKKLHELQKVFSRMEAYYHGSSSGLDPLVSYINKPILVNEYSLPEITTLPQKNEKTKVSAFLLDTKTVGETQPLVTWFMDKITDVDFKKAIVHELIPINNNCIINTLEGESKSLLKNVKKVSEFTLNNFVPMIPSHLIPKWKQGIESNNYYLKLCGSGGGGMMLGFTNDIDNAINHLSEFNLKIIFNF